MAATVGLLVHT